MTTKLESYICLLHLCKMENIVIDKTILLGWIRLVDLQEIDTQIILEQMNLSENQTTISFDTFAWFVDWVLETSKRNDWGLKFGEQSNLAALGIVGQIIQHSRTLGEALTHACQYFNLISNAIHLDLIPTEHTVKLVFNLHTETYQKHPRAMQQLVISSLYFSFKEIQYLTFSKIVPTQISLSFTPDNLEELNTLFKCNFNQDATENSLSFDTQILDQPIVYADYKLMLHLEKLACKRLQEQHNKQNSYVQKVTTLIYALVDPYFPSLKTIANQLHTSERSLQRKLANENTSYSQVLSSIKKSMAKEYLKQQLSIKEISLLLGYSEPSAFIHAFNHWYGESPKSYQSKI